MTPTDPFESPPAPILVLALGNLLLHDDGVGLALLERLRPVAEPDPRVELLDGGTQGIALLPRLAGRHSVLILDAVALGADPGTIHVIADARSARPDRGRTAHESNAGDLIAAAELIGDCPERLAVVGIEPKSIRTSVGLSEVVGRAVPDAVQEARRCLANLIESLELVTCTS
ncbi:MAG: hydrogenase maturation protease [Planctomycetota bacterium]